MLVIFTLHNPSLSSSAQEAIDQKKDMDEEDEEDRDESMEDDEDMSEEDMEEDKQGSLAKAAITGRSVTLQMLISEKIIEPGPALLSLKYLVNAYCVHVTVTIFSAFQEPYINMIQCIIMSFKWHPKNAYKYRYKFSCI